MHQGGDGANDGPSLVSNRAMEIVVALLLLGGAALVIYDSVRIGFGWREGEGPAPGYYPFWVATILAVSSLVNLIAALRGHGAGEIFVAARPFGRVLAVLVPSIIFVALIGYIGLYAAAALFIFTFMIAVGRENILKAIGVSVFVPVVLFFMFEKWFLVPLPKGPIEAMLGY
jgi:putative tricarboxylic transport membrane protein